MTAVLIETVVVAEGLGRPTFVHNRNYGYGRNQQTCYREALEANADIIIRSIPIISTRRFWITAMASMGAYDVYAVVLGSRILGTARLGGMHIHKYVANRFLTAFENFFVGQSSRSTTPDTALLAARFKPVPIA